VSALEHFARPDAWVLLVLVPAVALVLTAFDRGRARRLVRAVGKRAPRLASGLRPRLRIVRRLLFSAGLLMAVLAAMQPRWGAVAGRLVPRGADVVVALDVSRSMLAGDLAPTRLDAAVGEIRALAERAEGDRLGLVVFAGEATVLVPLTRDRRSFADLAGTAGPLTIPRGGTDLGAALDAAGAALSRREERPAVVILVTDGGDHEGRGLGAAESLAREGVTVHCLGFGSPRGAKIPVESGGGFLRDRAGREVVAAMDADALRKIAAATGGAFLAADASGRNLVRLYEDRVVPRAQAVFRAGERSERENRFQWPLLLAILLWTIELSIHERRR
jgi:Ca-activated chloride channel family protein